MRLWTIGVVVVLATAWAAYAQMSPIVSHSNNTVPAGGYLCTTNPPDAGACLGATAGYALDDIGGRLLAR